MHHNCDYAANDLLPFFENIVPDKKTVIEAMENPDVLITTFFCEPNKIIDENKAKNIVTYSGESYSYHHPKSKLNFTSHQTNNPQDIWFPYILSEATIDNLNILRNKNFKSINDRKNLLVYLSSNCTTKRDNFFKLFQKLSNNRGISRGPCLLSSGQEIFSANRIENLKLYEDFKFVLCFENKYKKGYVTEKILYAFLGGAIPIYWGCTDTVRELFNPETFIDLNSFENEESCIKYILELENNPNKLKKMQTASIFKDGIIHPMLNYRNVNSVYHKDVKNKIQKYLTL